jgi:hypothetical protein
VKLECKLNSSRLPAAKLRGKSARREVRLIAEHAHHRDLFAMVRRGFLVPGDLEAVIHRHMHPDLRPGPNDLLQAPLARPRLLIAGVNEHCFSFYFFHTYLLRTIPAVLH